MNNPSADLIKQAAAGSDEAYGILVDTYQKPVFHLCYRMLGSPQEAEDAAQETFWRAYQNLGKYDPGRSFITWLLSIAAHYCIDQNRRRKWVGVELDSLPEDIVGDPSPLPEKLVNSRLDEQRLHRLMGALPSQDRAALVMRYWMDIPEEEIARALSLSISALKSRLHRSRLLLSKRWEEETPQFSPEGGERHGSPAF